MDGSRPRSGERSERSLDADERPRKLEVGATAQQLCGHRRFIGHNVGNVVRELAAANG